MTRFLISFSVDIRRGLWLFALSGLALFMLLSVWGTYAVAATCTANATGNWNTAGTWTGCGGVTPTAADDVVINATRVVTLNTSPTVRTLNVSGTLQFGNNATARTLTVTIAGGGGNITVNMGGTLTISANNATHALITNGDFVNIGTVNLATTAARLCNVTFNRNGNQTVSGAGAYTFNRITLNMGATNANILDIQSNMTVPANFLTITNGTYKHSNTSNITPWTADPNIPASGGFWLNAAATVTTTGFNVTVNGGSLRISAGTMNIGNANTTVLALGNAATTLFRMDGGALNVTGGINSSTNTAAGTFTMSGGTITLMNVSAGAVYTFLLGSATTLTWSGGTIIATNGNNTTDDVDIRSATQNITGGTLQIGSAATTSPNDISYINGAGGQLNVWNLVLASGPARNILMRSSTNILNDLTIQALNNLNPGAGLAINIGAGNTSGNWTNNGTFTQGSTTVTFTGTSATSAIGGTSATTFNNFTINKASNNLTISTTPTVNGTLTFTSGDIVTGANRVILGTAATVATPSASSYVFGTVQKNYSAAGTFTFPVGDANNYTPVTIQGTAGFTAGNLAINTTGGDHPQVTTPIPSTGIDASQSVNRYWTLVASGLPVASVYNATFNFINGTPVDLDAGVVASTFIVERYDGSNWNPTTLGTAGASSTSITGVANVYGAFAIGESIPNFNGNPGAFNAFETTTPAGSVLGRLFTERLGAGTFTVSIVAVTNNAVNTTPSTAALTVAIIDAAPTGGTLTAASNCRTTWTTVIQTQTVPAAVAWVSGRIDVTITAPTQAVRNARIRVTQGGNVGCSTDNFTIRPQAFAVSSTNAGNTSTTGLPAVKTGANFNLTAASAAGYDGTPVLDNTKIVGTPTAGTIGGSFGAAPVGTGTASGASFFYNEVGNVGLLANAVFDSGFTNVDQTSDCTADFSNSLVGGKYGCFLGSTAVGQAVGVSGFGRFIPDNFNVSSNVPAFAPACGTFSYVGQTFTYSTAPTITVTARNGTNNGLTNATTTNYAGASYVKLTNASLTPNTQAARYLSFDALGGGTTPALSTANIPGAPGAGSDPTIDPFANGVGTLTFSSGTGLTFTRSTTTPNLPFSADIALAVNVIDGDGVFYAGNPVAFGTATAGNGITFIGAGTPKQMRFGRLTLSNALGSELLDLPIPIETQYFNSSGVYVTNVDDSCTSISLNNVFLSSGTATGGGIFASGKGNLKITKPLSKVSIDLCVDLDDATPTDPLCVAPSPADKTWLQWKWSGSNFDKDPKARATFGVYKNADEFIYLREVY